MATDAILTLDDVVAGYGKMTILNGVSASIRRGAITTVIGPNGAGKSTVFKTVFGLLGVRSGRVTFDGAETTSPRAAPHARRRHVLRAAGPQPLPRAVGAAQSRARRRGAGRPVAASPARMDAVMARFPMLREKANAQASTLSGGQQKQLEVARGLLLDPKLMLIDEPSIGLSPLMVQEVFAILKDLRDAGVTILMIEQNARQALAISDYGLVLEQGQTRIEDTAAEHPGRSAHRPALPGRRTGAGGRRHGHDVTHAGRPHRRQHPKSLAPALHEDAFAAAGIVGHYHLMDVATLQGRRLRDLLAAARTAGFAGVNITHPFKEAVIPLLDEVSTEATEIGAVNTVVFDKSGRTTGHNTDRSGFRHAFIEALGARRGARQAGAAAGRRRGRARGRRGADGPGRRRRCGSTTRTRRAPPDSAPTSSCASAPIAASC